MKSQQQSRTVSTWTSWFRVFTTRLLVQWISWVFAIQERETLKESRSIDVTFMSLPESKISAMHSAQEWRNHTQTPRMGCGRAAARGFSPAPAVRHPKFGISVRGFACYCGIRVFHRLFYFLFVIEGRVFIGNWFRVIVSGLLQWSRLCILKLSPPKTTLSNWGLIVAIMQISVTVFPQIFANFTFLKFCVQSSSGVSSVFSRAQNRTNHPENMLRKPCTSDCHILVW